MDMVEKMVDPAFAELIALVEAFLREWPGPAPVPHAVAHQDPRSGLLTFHVRGLPEHLAFIAAAVRVQAGRTPVRGISGPVAADAVQGLHAAFRGAHDGDGSSNDLAQLVDDWFVAQGLPTVLYAAQPGPRPAGIAVVDRPSRWP